jgi:hypothetical protein
MKNKVCAKTDLFILHEEGHSKTGERPCFPSLKSIFYSLEYYGTYCSLEKNYSMVVTD